MSSITREAVLAMDLKSIFAAVKDPKTAADMQKLMGDRGSGVATHISKLMLEAQTREAEVDSQLARTVPPSTEALAAEAQTMAAQPVVAEVPPVPVETVPVPVVKPYEAEDSELKKLGITVLRDANGVVSRYVEEYQVVGEDGKAIGRPTHLEARTLPEFLAKKREVHTQATRAFHRLKQQKLTFKQEKTVLSPEAIAEAARIALESKDSAKVTDVIHQVIETEYQQRERELKEKQWREDGRTIANTFMRNHLHDYNPCEANNKALGEYLEKHNLDYTLDNLEAAFQDLFDQGDKLAKVETVATRQAVEVANPTPTATPTTPVAPAIPGAETPVAVPSSVVPAQPVAVVAPPVEATAPTPVAAPNVQPATRRPGVNGGIAPGSLSAQRPGTPDPALTRKEFLQDFLKQKPEEMKRRVKDPQYAAKLRSYGVKV
jgi:hypothetical protein